MVFVATTWSPTSQTKSNATGKLKKSKIQFAVARYGLTSVKNTFLLDAIPKLIVFLSNCGFIVDTIVGDGAGENRSVFKTFATITANVIFKDHFDKEFLKTMPMDTKIAFPHPNPEYADKVKIFIGGEMPHWVKRFRNVLDNKKKKLQFRNGFEFSLATLEKMWKEMGDSKVHGRADVRRYKFGQEHFTINSYNKMRVFLAVQIPSQTMIKMIKDYCKCKDDANIKDYEPMIELFEKVDRLVNVINATKVTANSARSATWFLPLYSPLLYLRVRSFALTRPNTLKK